MLCRTTGQRISSPGSTGQGGLGYRQHTSTAGSKTGIAWSGERRQAKVASGQLDASLIEFTCLIITHGLKPPN